MTDPIIDNAIKLPKCETGLNNSSLLSGTKPILLHSESDEYPVIGPFWTLIRHGSLFIWTIPLDEEDDTMSDMARIAYGLETVADCIYDIEDHIYLH